MFVRIVSWSMPPMKAGPLKHRRPAAAVGHEALPSRRFFPEDSPVSWLFPHSHVEKLKKFGHYILMCVYQESKSSMRSKMYNIKYI